MQNDGHMPRTDLRVRTKAFALDVVRLVESLPRTRTADVVGGQLLRSGTSVAANYRAACRARSRREFIAKMGIVLEEADESEFWLELVDDCALQGPDRVTKLRAEAGELVAMAAASVLTARAKSRSILQSSLCTQQSKCS
jgi:four helix bundle protein